MPPMNPRPRPIEPAVQPDGDEAMKTGEEIMEEIRRGTSTPGRHGAEQPEDRPLSRHEIRMQAEAAKKQREQQQS